MASQSKSSEGLEVARDYEPRVGCSSLVEEHITAEKPTAQFGELYHDTASLDDPKDTVMLGMNVEIEADDDGDQSDTAVGHDIIREAIKKIRDRRLEGYEDKLRVQRKIGRRKNKPLRQRTKKDKHRKEEKPDEPAESNSSQPQPQLQPPRPAPEAPREYIAPSCTRVRMIRPDRPLSPTLAGTAFSTSSRGLLAQLREIEMNSSKAKLPEAVDSVMESPVPSPTSSPKSEPDTERETRNAWRADAIQKRYMGLMDFQSINLIDVTPTSPYEMRDQYYSRMSDSPSP